MPAPTVTSITPNTGTASGGTIIAVIGTGFVNGAELRIGGTLATEIQFINSVLLTAKAPAHPLGAATVLVTNPDQLFGQLVNGFTFTGFISAKRATIIDAAKRQLLDTDPTIPLLEQGVWDASLDSALAVFSQDYPLRKQMTIEFQTDKVDYAMPAGFITFHPPSFNQAVNPQFGESQDVLFQDIDFDSELTTADRSFTFDKSSFVLDVKSRNNVFARNTHFDFIDNGAGGKTLMVTPAPLNDLTAKCFYYGNHTIGLVSSVDTDTTPADQRFRLIAKIAEIALLVIQRATAADANLTARLADLRSQMQIIYRRGGSRRRHIGIA